MPLEMLPYGEYSDGSRRGGGGRRGGSAST